MCTGEVGEGPVVESSVELAVHKAAGRVEVFPGPVVATGAGGARETDETRREEDGVDDNFTEGGEAAHDKSAGGVEVWSLERYELEKQTKLLINPPKE